MKTKRGIYKDKLEREGVDSDGGMKLGSPFLSNDVADEKDFFIDDERRKRENHVCVHGEGRDTSKVKDSIPGRFVSKPFQN